MKNSTSFLDNLELAELHAHLGAALSGTELWEMAHDQGLKLPTKDYRTFEKMVSVGEAKDLEDQLKIFDLTEKIQSSPEAMFHAVQHVISEAYRKNNITTIELRFNPIFRCQEGERDMDHILIFALQGMERAQLKYNVRAGLILCLDRRLSLEKNAAIVRKAIKYHDRGIVGIDMAGPTERNKYCRSFQPKDITNLVSEAKEAGLGITFHTGEATDTEEMWQVVEELKPNRIGHGVACVNDEKLMDKLREENIVLELCPYSNLHTKVLKDYQAVKNVIDALKKHGVLFTINTDWPATLSLSLRDLIAELVRNRILSEKEIIHCNEIAHQAAFVHVPFMSSK
ncbi:MAG: adenosine deaminase [Patescibacteria group bacterium]